MKIDIYTLMVFIRHIIWINSLLNAFRLKKILHLIGFHHEQFWYAFSIYFFFKIFYYKSHISKVSNILSQILHLKKISYLKRFKYSVTNITFGKFSSRTILMWFLNLYFLSNIFEKFSSWTISICFLNPYFLSNILLQISHLKSFKYFATNVTFESFHHE